MGLSVVGTSLHTVGVQYQRSLQQLLAVDEKPAVQCLAHFGVLQLVVVGN